MGALGWMLAITLAVQGGGVTALGQKTVAPQATGAATMPHRTRLFLKDKSYQIVMSYTVSGSVVRFVSAERGGEIEEIPLRLVDLEATRRWEAEHAPDPAPGQERPAPALDPELAKEEADRAALTPEVAPDLRLAPEDAALGLDTWQGAPELVPLLQTESDLNRETGHKTIRSSIKPHASTHRILVLKGEKAPVQMHVNDPVFYVRLGDGMVASGQALTVDTHGASSSPAVQEKKTNPREYVVVRLDVRQDARVVASFDVDALGSGKRQEDVVETELTLLPGGHWAKVRPRENLLVGEYALVEVLEDGQLNLGLWDFGVHPTAPENRDVLRPEKPRAKALERRGK